MPRSRFFGFGRVNLIKKVKVDGEWKFCPAVVGPGRKLNDLVRVNGETETHSEGTYYLEWREQGQRRRQPVHNRALVFDQARLKGLELEAERKPAEIASLPESPLSVPVDTASLPQPFVAQPVVAHQFPGSRNSSQARSASRAPHLARHRIVLRGNHRERRPLAAGELGLDNAIIRASHDTPRIVPKEIL